MNMPKDLYTSLISKLLSNSNKKNKKLRNDMKLRALFEGFYYEVLLIF